MIERDAINRAWDAMVQTHRAHAVIKRSGEGFDAVAVDALLAGTIVEHLIIPAHWGFNNIDNNPPEILWRYKEAA